MGTTLPKLPRNLAKFNYDFNPTKINLTQVIYFVIFNQTNKSDYVSETNKKNKYV